MGPLVTAICEKHFAPCSLRSYPLVKVLPAPEYVKGRVSHRLRTPAANRLLSPHIVKSCLEKFVRIGEVSLPRVVIGRGNRSSYYFEAYADGLR